MQRWLMIALAAPIMMIGEVPSAAQNPRPPLESRERTWHELGTPKYRSNPSGDLSIRRGNEGLQNRLLSGSSRLSAPSGLSGRGGLSASGGLR